MAGYTRQESGNIVDGNIIQASHLNNEYNQLESAFNATTGHAHDGSTGNAPQIDLTTSVTGALPVANGGTNATTASAARISLGLVIGTNVQAEDAGLTSIAGLTTAADKMIYTTASDTYATSSLTSFARTLLDDASASVARTTLGLTIGTDVQAEDAGLTSIAGLTTAADQMIYTTASDTYAVAALTSFGRSLIDDASASAARTTLGLVIGTNVQAEDAGLTSIAGLTTAADKMIYTTASDTYATSSLTSFARTLLDDASASVARTTLGLTIGTDVQAYDSNLATYISNALSSAELQQLQNINTSTISTTQWGYLGGLDQALTTGSSVTFSGVSGATLTDIDYTVDTVTTAMNFSNGNSGTVTATGNITFTFSNVPSGLAIYTLFLTNGGAHTMTWPAAVTWGDAGTPTLQSSGVDILTFVSHDGGTTFYGTQSWTG